MAKAEKSAETPSAKTPSKEGAKKDPKKTEAKAAPSAPKSTADLVKRQGATNVRAQVRKDQPRDPRYDDRIASTAHDLRPEAVERGVRVMFPLDGMARRQKRGEQAVERQVIFRLSPAVDEVNSNKFLNPLVIEDGEPVETGWFDVIMRATFGHGISKTSAILYDPLDPNYQASTNWAQINPYARFRKTAYNSSRYRLLAEREKIDDADSLAATLGYPMPYTTTQGWLVYDSRMETHLSMAEVAAQPPTVFINPERAGRAMRNAVLESYRKARAIKDGVDIPDELKDQGIHPTFNPFHPALGCFMVVREFPSEKGNNNEFSVQFRKSIKFGGKPYDAHFNGLINAQTILDRWQYWGDTLHYMSDQELAVAVAHSVVGDPLACECLEQAWAETPFFDYLPKELSQEVARKAEASRRHELSESTSQTSEAAFDGAEFGDHDIFGGAPTAAEGKTKTKKAEGKKTKKKETVVEDEPFGEDLADELAENDGVDAEAPEEESQETEELAEEDEDDGGDIDDLGEDAADDDGEDGEDLEDADMDLDLDDDPEPETKPSKKKTKTAAK
jgi:hypothetical protein